MKTRFLIEFPEQLASEPITYNLIKKYNLSINILKAHINIDMQGFLLIEIEGEEDNIKSAVKYMRKLKAKVTPMESIISIDMHKCIHCGTCVTTCKAGALIRDNKAKIYLDGKLCTECMLCINACPLHAIQSIF
jgi:ferredoxin